MTTKREKIIELHHRGLLVEQIVARMEQVSRSYVLRALKEEGLVPKFRRWRYTERRDKQR